MTDDSLARLQAHLAGHEGRITAADVPLGVAVLREYLESGAAMGRSLRRVRAAMKPVDAESIQLSYLFNLVVDAANHEGRLAPVEAYAASDFPLADAAKEMLAIMTSEKFAAQVGWRPAVPGDRRPAAVAKQPSRPEIESAGYWQRRYELAETGWDAGAAEPTLLDLHQKGVIRPGRMLIPCCGYGWEATAFAALGYDVTAFDFAETPVVALRERAAEQGLSLQAVKADLFDLPAAWDGSFDIVLERACFCAIAPERRDDYVRIVHRLLKPGGKLVGLFYVPERAEGGPPFPATEAELGDRFSGLFADVRLTPVEHLFGRLGVLTKAQG